MIAAMMLPGFAEAVLPRGKRYAVAVVLEFVRMI
jgi:hypothetical protein